MDIAKREYLGDAWTLTQSPQAIRDAGYEPCARLALCWNAGADDVVVFADGNIEDVSRWMRDNADINDGVSYFILPADQFDEYAQTHACGPEEA